MTVNAPLIVHRPLAATCPCCGTASFTQVKGERGTTPTTDRQCKGCGTRYMTIPALMSSTAQTAMYVSGVVCLLAGVLSGLVWLAGMQGRLQGGSLSAPLYGIILQVMIGFSLLRGPERMQQLREKRLEDYQTSTPPGTPPPVEIPRPPDVVFMSTMFGYLSLVSVAPVFGLAALCCGIVALTQGHLKGLIGMALGVVGLVIWGLVFVYFFQG